VRYAAIAQTSQQLVETSSRKQKVELLARLLGELAPDERAIAARHLSGDVAHKLGIGYATVGELRGQVEPAPAASLTVVEVDRRFAAIAALQGAGSGRAKREAFGAMLALATALEQGFLGALVIGELRQGAQGALVVDAVAVAAGLPARTVRAAHMLAGDLGVVAAAALGEGAAGSRGSASPCSGRCCRCSRRPPRPPARRSPASADPPRSSSSSTASACRSTRRTTSSACTRARGTMSQARCPRSLRPPPRCPRAGSSSMARRARSAPAAARCRSRTPCGGRGSLTLTLFDALLVDDQTMLASPAGERFTALGELAPAYAVPRLVTSDPAAADAYFDAAIARGHEGVMAKALEAPYDAGNRGAAWLKIKKVYHLDLVVLAVEWGSGRRHGWLSNLHLGARDPAGGWVMLGKTFTGLTDEVLAWQTAQLLAREVDRDGHIVYVRPELVVEIAFNDVQRSSRYPGGFALRLARVVRYRGDKTAAEADTIDAVRAIAIRDGVVPP